MHRIGAIGIKDKDLLVLKSLLGLVGKTINARCDFVEDPAEARVVFIGKLPPADVAALAAQFAGKKLLVHCQAGDETPPGVRTLAHCPPRLSELAALFGELYAAPAAPAEAAAPASFDPNDCLAGAIQLRIPKLLIEHPLLVHSPKGPPLLVDANAGVRTVHADPAWFRHPEPWRAPVAECRLEVELDHSKIADLRRYPARPFLGMRFWGVMCASNGRLSSQLQADRRFGLRKLPDFKRWPHHPWQGALADQMLKQAATLDQLTALAGRARSEVVDFLNATKAVGLLLDKHGQ